MSWQVGSGLSIASILVVVIVTAAMLIWVERRLLGFWQDRLGPNRVGPFGLLQVVAEFPQKIDDDNPGPPLRQDDAHLPYSMCQDPAPSQRERGSLQVVTTWPARQSRA